MESFFKLRRKKEAQVKGELEKQVALQQVREAPIFFIFFPLRGYFVYNILFVLLPAGYPGINDPVIGPDI